MSKKLLYNWLRQAQSVNTHIRQYTHPQSQLASSIKKAWLSPTTEPAAHFETDVLKKVINNNSLKKSLSWNTIEFEKSKNKKKTRLKITEI